MLRLKGWGQKDESFILLLMTAAVTLEHFGHAFFPSPHFTPGLQHCRVLKCDCVKKQLLRNGSQETAAAVFHATGKFLWPDSPQAPRFTYPWPLRSKKAKLRSQGFSTSSVRSRTPPQSPPISSLYQWLPCKTCRSVYIRIKEGSEGLAAVPRMLMDYLAPWIQPKRTLENLLEETGTGKKVGGR